MVAQDSSDFPEFRILDCCELQPTVPHLHSQRVESGLQNLDACGRISKTRAIPDESSMSGGSEDASPLGLRLVT